MRRSWLIWFASVLVFFLTVIVVVTSGTDRASVAQQEQLVAAQSTDQTALGLPKVEIEGQTELSHNKSSRGNTDFTVNESAVEKHAVSQVVPASGAGDLYAAVTAYQPPEIVQIADPSNYGDRVTHDVNGNPVNNDYIVVLHETVGSAMSALNLFQVNHPRDEDQVSYHTLIAEDGTVVYVVPPEQRAFGAGDSVFTSSSGEESVTTKAGFPSSVNNFAYHVSLETPPDGRNNNSTTHSGYTEAQYQSLAWLIARSNVPDDRITTHKAVDRSGTRMDPRSFEAERMYRLLRQYPSRQGLG